MDSSDDFQSSVEEDYKREATGPYNREQEALLVQDFKDMFQYPNAGLIKYGDLVWLSHATSGKHTQVESKIAAIPWDRLQDFVEGQEQNAEYPTTFNWHVKKRNLAGLLARPQVYFCAQLIRYKSCLGLHDHLNVVPEDVQAILVSTVKKRKKCAFNVSGKRRGKKVVPQYDVLPTTQSSQVKRCRVEKLQTGRSIKRGCQCCFFAKQLYQDPTICQIIYQSTNHTNKEGHIIYGVSVAGFKDTLGSALSTEMKAHLRNLLWLGLSPSQVIAQHKIFVKNLGGENGNVNRDTFLQAQDVRNLAKTRDKALSWSQSGDGLGR